MESWGALWRPRGKNDEAISELEKAVALDPENAQLHYALGHAYRAARMADKAKKELAIAAKMYASKDGSVKR